MSIPIARVGDIATGICRAHKYPIPVTGIIANGSPSVTVDGLPLARVGDVVTFDCGHTGVIISGLNTGQVDGKVIAHIGSLVVGPMQAVIIKGSPTTG